VVQGVTAGSQPIQAARQSVTAWLNETPSGSFAEMAHPHNLYNLPELHAGFRDDLGSPEPHTRRCRHARGRTTPRAPAPEGPCC
jgi:hypothetical protein